jgi:hypothetical protein
MDTLGARRAFAEAAAPLAKSLRVTQRPDEAPEAFLTRVRTAAIAKGLGAELEEQLADLQSRTRSQALVHLVAVDALKAELAKRHVPLPDDANDASALRDALTRSIAAAVGQDPDSAQVKDAVEDAVDSALYDAFWAPHQAVLDEALSDFDPDSRAATKDYLTQVYGAKLGALAPERIARELQNGGPAKSLVALLASTGTLRPRLADLVAAAAADPSLATLLPAQRPAESGVDAVQAGTAPVTFQWGDRGLEVKLGDPQPDPLTEQVREGKLHLEWVQDDTGAALAFCDATGQAVDDAKAVQAAADVLRGPLRDLGQRVAEAWHAGKPPVKDLIAQSGLAPYLGSNPADFLLQVPSLARALKADVLQQSLKGGSADALVSRAGRLGFPSDNVQQLYLLDSQVRALSELSPPPFDLNMVIQGKSKKLTLPLTPGEKLTPSQRAALSTVQHYLDAIAAQAGESPTLAYGELDTTTAALLRRLYDVPAAAKTVDLTPGGMAKLVAAAADAMGGRQVMAGELIFHHPVLAHVGNAKVDPTRLVVEYLKAQGFTFSADPPKADPSLFSALDASAARPVDEQVLQLAKLAASKLGPYPPTVRDALLTRKAFIAGANPKVFAMGPSPTAADAQTLARQLAPLTRPMSLHTVALGERHRLPKEEPLVALKLVLAKLAAQPLPVNADGVIDGYLTSGDLRALRDLCYGKDGAASSTAYARWTRVAGAVDSGQVTLADLNDTPGKTPLQRDVNAVLGDLRQMAQAIGMSTIPEDAASASVAADLGKYPPLKTLPQPLVVAQALLAQHFGASPPAQPSQQGALGADDVERMQRLMAEPESKASVPDYPQHAGDVRAVLAAVRQGRLSFTSNRVQTSPRDPALEDSARVVADLFVQAGEVLQTRARARNLGAAHGMYRAGLDAYQHTFTLPDFWDSLVFNSVKDWTVVALKAEMMERGKAADPSVSAALRGALAHPDVASLQAVLRQQKNLPDDDRQTLEAVVQAAQLGNPEVQDILSRAAASQQTAMTQVDGAFLKYLVEAHGDELGRSLASTLISGEPSPLPPGADARKLLLDVAAKMKQPWDSLNVTLQDTDPEVRTAKSLVQEALSRLNGGSTVWGGLVPGRDADVAGTLVKRLLALDGTQLAPYLKSFCIQQGFASVEEVAGIRSPDINLATLRASVELAKKATGIWNKHDPEIGKKMAADEKVLQAAVARGQPLSLNDTSTPEAKALGDLLANTALAFGSTGGMDPIDFGSVLANVQGDLKIRHLQGTVVSAAPASGDLSAVSASVGRELPWTDEESRALTDWTHHVQFDEGRALQTAFGSAVMFRHLMPTMVGYHLWVTPFIESGQALSSWARGARDASETFARLGSTWQDWVDLQSQMLSYMTPLPFASEIKSEVQQGKLDVALGKAVVYTPMMIATLRGMAGLGQAAHRRVRNAYGRFTPREAFDVTGAAGRSEAVALGETGVATSRLYRSAVRTGRALRRVKTLALDPREAWREVGKGIKWMGDRAGVRNVKLDAGKGDFELKLPEETAQWVADHPGGRTQLTLLRKGKEYDLDLSNRDLVELGKSGASAPKALLERMGLSGRDTAPVVQSLAEAARQLPAPTAKAAGAVPKLGELMDPSRTGATTVWRVEVDGRAETLSLENGTLGDLVEAYYRKGGGAYAKLLEKNGLTAKEPLVRAVLSNYSSEGVTSLALTERPVADVDQFLRPESYRGKADPIAGKGGTLLYRAEAEGAAYAVVQRADGRLQVLEGKADISATPLGKKVLSGLEALKSKYGTTNPTHIAQLKKIETESAHWSEAMSTTQGRVSSDVRAAYQKWAQEVETHFQGTLSEGELSTAAGRVQLNLLKAKLGVQGLQMELRAGGLTRATAKLVRGTASTLGGQLKSPCFYLVLAVQGQQFLVNLGDTLNDDSLTSLQKAKQGLTAAAITGGGIIAGTAAMGVLSRIFPRVGAAASGVGTALLLKELASGEIADDAVKALMRLRGEKNPLQAMQIWKALGVPEAGYFKIDPDQHPQAHGFGKLMERVFGAGTPEVDDIGTLGKDRGDMPTPRLSYWGSDPQSPLMQRIRQLCGLPANSPQTPIQRPQDVDLAKVKSYTEPVWSTVQLLQKLPDIERRDPLMAQTAAARGFQFDAWQADVTGAAQNILAWVHLEGDDAAGAQKVLSFDENALRALLARNDRYAALNPQERQVLDRKLSTEMQQFSRWTAVLNHLAIDPAQKQVALVKLIENMASNHLANSILFEYVPKKNVELKGGRSWWYSQVEAPPADTNIDDYYTVTRTLLANF